LLVKDKELDLSLIKAKKSLIKWTMWLIHTIWFGTL
jgi:hypothetical protein